MKNNTQGKILNILIDKYTKNVERYTHNGSTWLIFTEEKKWVIELTKEGTLWYNYYFFQNIMKLLSLDVVENQHYITEWVEDTVINGVKSTKGEYYKEIQKVEYTIQNGVKQTKRSYEGSRKQRTKDTIQNGVKRTELGGKDRKIDEIKYIVENGVKETKHNTFEDGLAMEEAIQNGVKYTEYGDWEDGDERLDDIIQNGIKETTPGGYLGFVEMKGKKIHQFETAKQLYYVEDVIESGIKKTEGGVLFDESKIDTVISEGIKETNPHFLHIMNPMNFEPEIKEMKRMNEVNIVLEKGIKEVQPLPAQMVIWIGVTTITDKKIEQNLIPNM
jgi:hypothetical protein